MLDKLEAEWPAVVAAVSKDKNIQKRTRGVGIADRDAGEERRRWSVRWRARRESTSTAGAIIRTPPMTGWNSRSSPPTAAMSGRGCWCAWQEVFESIRIIRQCLENMQDGPLDLPIHDELPAGRMGLSSVEAPRGESHHFVITGENNRPRRWRVRAPTYQNLQGIPVMIKDQQTGRHDDFPGQHRPVFLLHGPAGDDRAAVGRDQSLVAGGAPAAARAGSRRRTRHESHALTWMIAVALAERGRAFSLLAPFFQGVTAQDHGTRSSPARARRCGSPTSIC